MENMRNGQRGRSFDGFSWNKEDSEELVLLYLNDYYKTLDEYFLQEALQIAKDEGVDLQKMLRLAKTKMN